MVSELEMACHMWKVYTKNAERFGIVEIHLNSKITITAESYQGTVNICEFERFAEESAFFNFVKKDVESLGGRTIIKWSG